MIESRVTGWNAIRLKSCFKQLTDSIQVNATKVGLENIEGGTGRYVETSSEFDGDGIDFKKGDILFGKLRPYLKKVYLAKFNGEAVGDFFIFRCYKGIDNKFMSIVLLSDEVIEKINSGTYGAKMPRAKLDDIYNLIIKIPSYSEQRSIANYLDSKCSKIDASIATLKEMKDKYLSLKKSLINETVCRGLNKNIPLKSSGIDWIGNIPKYWEVKRMKNICTYISRGCTPNYVDEGIIYTMNQATFSSGYIDYAKARFTDKPDFSALVKIDDLLIASTGGGVLGKVVYVDQLKGTFYADSHVSIVRSIEKVVNNKFLYYFFKIHFGTINALLAQGSTNQTELQKDELNNFVVPVPSIAEQQSIATYLDDKCSKMDSIVANIDSQIESYTKLKKSLISEVVTGKKQVI